jgi:hypothetical protein
VAELDISPIVPDSERMLKLGTGIVWPGALSVTQRRGVANHLHCMPTLQNRLAGLGCKTNIRGDEDCMFNHLVGPEIPLGLQGLALPQSLIPGP